jgi:2-oxoisovalerate ferredoxin oxidoreductase gamma subunit
MKEIRFHGRAGQGVVVGAKILANAFLVEGKCVATFPMYGVARRGSPVSAFIRLDDKPIREKCQVYRPHCLLIAEPSMVNSPEMFRGLQSEGMLVLNAPQPLEESPHENLRKIGVLDATGIALKETGTLVANIPLLAAFAATTDWVTLDSLLSCLKEYFTGSSLERNFRSAVRGFREVKITDLKARRDAVSK